MAALTVTDRNGNTLQKGDKVLVEMVVGDMFINPAPGREVLLTADSEGAPPISLYTSAVHITKKDDQSATQAAPAPGRTANLRGANARTAAGTRVTAPGAPKNPDGTLNTEGAQQTPEGFWEYPDGTIRRPDGSVV